MNLVNYINAFLEIWGCSVGLIIMWCVRLSRKNRRECDQLFMWIIACNFGSLFFDLLALLFRGHPGMLCWWGVRISNFIAFACGYALLESFTHYVTCFIGRRTRVSPRPLMFSRYICIFSLSILVLTQFVPIIYTIDAQNVYHRAPLFWISMATGLAGMIVNIWLLLRYHKVLDKRDKLALWAYMVLPAIAMIIQIFVYGLVLLNFADTIGIIMIFLFIQVEQARIAEEQEKQLIQERISIMMSQIQPHFLFNALASIQEMCHGKAPEAEEAAMEFAEFLRGNLDSLQAKSPIPFEQELRHTRNYLSLEQKRFGDRLRVEYYISTTDFNIPALTLQPLVENAVRYGAMGREEGGTVKIATQETMDSYMITVADDGMGFDMAARHADGRSHIGISNVKERLQVMCSGNVHIESTPGIGTTVVITIPKIGIRAENS